MHCCLQCMCALCLALLSYGNNVDALVECRRKELWKAEATSREAVKVAEGEAMCKKSELSKLMAPDILTGLQSLEKLVKDNNVPGVLGPLIDLVDCRESMRRCVEVWYYDSHPLHSFLLHEHTVIRMSYLHRLQYFA
jgi:hypothetical protein